MAENAANTSPPPLVVPSHHQRLWAGPVCPARAALAGQWQEAAVWAVVAGRRLKGASQAAVARSGRGPQLSHTQLSSTHETDL